MPQITAVHTSYAGIPWSFCGHGRFAGNDEETRACALLEMLKFRPDSAILFLSALKDQERRARIQGQPIWLTISNLVPESPVMRRERPAYTVRIPKQAVRP